MLWDLSRRVEVFRMWDFYMWMQAGILVLTVSPDVASSPHVWVEVHAFGLSEHENIAGDC